MLEVENEEALCPICYHFVSLDNLVELFECKHRYCDSCSQYIMLAKNQKCPLDLISFKFVIKRNQKFSLEEFQRETLLINKDDIEQIWYGILNNQVESIHNYLTNLQHNKKILMSHLNKTDICESEITELKVGFQDMKISIENSNEENHFIIYDKFLLSENMYENAVKDENIFIVNIFESNMLKFVKHFPTINLHDRKFAKLSSDIILRKEKIELIEKIINKTKFVLFFMKKFVLTMIENNEDIFKMISTNQIDCDVNKCLICTNEINMNLYAIFPTCDHKICSECINLYVITHASCPFHNHGHRYLIMYKNIDYEITHQTIIKYVSTNLETICFDMIQSSIAKGIGSGEFENYIINNNFLFVIETLHDLVIQINKRKPNNENIKNLIDIIQPIFNNFQITYFTLDYQLQVYINKNFLKSLDFIYRYVQFSDPEESKEFQRSLLLVNKLLKDMININLKFKISFSNLNDLLKNGFDMENLCQVKNEIKHFFNCFNDLFFYRYVEKYLSISLESCNKLRNYLLTVDNDLKDETKY